jgi:hypothetical protein
VGRLANFRAGARDWSLIFFCALGVYGVSFLLSGQISLLLSVMAAKLALGTWSRVVLGMITFDLSKAPALFMGAMLLALGVRLSPLGLALGLTVMVYAMDLALTMLLHQADWLWFQPVVLALRLVSMGLLGTMVLYTVRWRRRK